MGSSNDAGRDNRLLWYQRDGIEQGMLATYIDAMSFTPTTFLTNDTIILSLPLSPASPVSGTETGLESSSYCVASTWDMIEQR